MSPAFAIIFLFVCSASIATSQQTKHISTLVPSCGPMNRATTVTIKGKGFLPTDQVKFGATVLSKSHVEYKSNEEIMLIMSGAYVKESKNFTVNVLSKDGKTNSNIMYYFVYDTPNYIQEIQPKTGWEGDTLVAKGRFLDCGAVKCRFGAVQMTVDAFYVSHVEIKCKVPDLDNHGVSSMLNQNETSNSLTQKKLRSKASNNSSNGTSSISQIDYLQKVDLPPPPPDPDNAKRFTISSDGQHFDSIPDNIVFTFRDPVKYVSGWIWICRYILGPVTALCVLSCLGSCCCSSEKKKKKKKKEGYSKIKSGSSGGFENSSELTPLSHNRTT